MAGYLFCNAADDPLARCWWSVCKPHQRPRRQTA